MDGEREGGVGKERRGKTSTHARDDKTKASGEGFAGGGDAASQAIHVTE
jgi:hypothetical protein